MERYFIILELWKNVMNSNDFNSLGERIADDDIYLNKKFPKEPKEIFKPIISLIENCKFQSGFNLCDVGCATGEFLAHAQNVFPHCNISGIDFSKSLIEEAKKNIPTGNFFVKSIEEKNALGKRKFDVINMKGVLTIFDDPRPILLNCLSAMKKNGLLLVTNFFNEDPIDVLVRYRRADKKNSPLEKGWNMHSCFTIEEQLRNSDYDLEINWHDFVMPFPIKRGDDPMRTWTTQVGNSKNISINGACQIINFKILEIRIKDFF
jgi:2-polyprenyl-3-methyl-5-hydroxy-6-metoxy-1,4-benzoquinol methylase